MKKSIGFILLVLVCFCVKSCIASSSSNEANDSSHSSKVSKKSNLKIYNTKITNEIVEQAGTSDDCDIIIQGTTDAPDGSIVYAQRGNGEGNLAYGGEDGDTDNKVKDHHFEFSLLTSNLFGLDDSLKVGKKVDLKIFCTNENFKYSLDDSGLISKKVRRKVASSDIEPYTVKVTKKMVHVYNYGD